MPQKIKQEDGTELEVFTQAELEEQANQRAEAAAQKAREEAEAAKQEELDRLAEEKEALEVKLKDKDKNWKQLRDKAEGKGGDSEELKKQIESISKRLEEIGQQPIKTALTTFVSANLPEDKDKREKFDYYYAQLSREAKTAEDHQKAMNDALALVLPGQKPNLDYQLYGSRISQDFRQPQNADQKSETHRAFSQAMGLSEEDHKKYGKKNR